jgi:Zn-dependent peptidase ImmA (M78 family)/DNA-binding XRE family transcriptional regulator
MEPTDLDGNRIRLARESRAMTQGDLAKLVDVSTALVSRWELQLSSPIEELQKISMALGYPETFFLAGRIRMPSILSHQYRKSSSSMSIKDKKTVEALAYIRVDYLAAMIRQWVEFEWHIPKYDADSLAPEKIAHTVRYDLKLNKGPIPSLMKVIESLGIFIFLESFQDSALDGLTIQIDGIPPVIFINADRPGERVRFTLAHEFGHLIMHQSPREEMEKEANRFAAEFLMPSDDIYCDLSNASLLKIASLKPYWKASIQALVYRAQEINAIQQAKARRLFMEINKNGWKKNEPNPLPHEIPELSAHLIEYIKKETGLELDDMCRVIGANTEEVQSKFLRENRILKLYKH